jgi:CubicO group peptidase (beta-lactamase class C family)
MATRLLLLLGTFGLTHVAYGEQSGPQPKQRPDFEGEALQRELTALRRDIDRKLKDLRVPGAAVGIVKDGEVVLLSGFGYRDWEKKLPVTPNTKFMIASVTKSFVATSVLMAQEDGKLNLSDAPNKHLPYFGLRTRTTVDAPFTVADLMAHSSGLPRTDTLWVSGRLTPEQNIRALASAEPTFSFRENAQYSNILFHAAAEVVGAATGTPWPQFVEERIWKPLGMKQTTLKSIPEMTPGDEMANGTGRSH